MIENKEKVKMQSIIKTEKITICKIYSLKLLIIYKNLQLRKNQVYLLNQDKMKINLLSKKRQIVYHQELKKVKYFLILKIRLAKIVLS